MPWTYFVKGKDLQHRYYKRIVSSYSTQHFHLDPSGSLTISSRPRLVLTIEAELSDLVEVIIHTILNNDRGRYQH